MSRNDWDQHLPRFLQPPPILCDLPRHSERLLRPRYAALFFLAALILVPWTVGLFLTLPSSAEAARWNTAWGGFDALLILVFAGCAIRIMRLSPRSAAVTAAAAALLVTDAWFDIMLAPTTRDLVAAVLMAALVELPLAALCLRTSFRVLNVLEQARPYLRQAGFTIEQGRLVPPPDWEERIRERPTVRRDA
ncbi:hypothetical protein [Streptacidiphilus monticola]|jgi:hypothetical protein|uniref:Uncharacterized protein n=1 Tax=Streptacidiphilus monticola TaxID=2161674 RepID=A0ABW1G859_9ACTN